FRLGLRYGIGGVAVRATRLVLSCSCTRRQHDRSHRGQESVKDYVPHGCSLPHYVGVGRLRALYHGHTGGGYTAPGEHAVPEAAWRLQEKTTARIEAVKARL